MLFQTLSKVPEHFNFEKSTLFPFKALRVNFLSKWQYLMTHFLNGKLKKEKKNYSQQILQVGKQWHF